MKLGSREMLGAFGALLLCGNAAAQRCDCRADETRPEREFGASLDSDGEPTRLIGVDPAYPPAAATAGIEGYVELRFTVSPSGTVIMPEVVAAEPAGVFDAAALAAVSRWRYTRPAAGEQPELSERLEFALSAEVLALAGAAAPAEPIAAREPVRNYCVREATRYDFGAMIDISLINACDEPLLVYSCAAGAGHYRDRWICRDPERTATLLRPSMAAATAATEGLASVGRIEITRAPNSEYWWLACSVGDSACRGDGSQWIRSMDRQLVNVDPRDRTRARLARSY